MTESKHEHKGIIYEVTEIGGEYKFFVPFRNFTSEWFNVVNSMELYGLSPEKAVHKNAQWLIEQCYT
jgi:hypothetical protein